MATSTQQNKPSKPTVHFLRTYRFRKDEKDPIIDRIRTCMDDSGYDIARVAEESGLSYGTVYNWIDGKTRRPQYCTAVAAIRSMGYDLAVVPTTNKANGHAWAASAPKIIKRFRSTNA